MKKRKNKGEIGYINYQKVYTIIRTVLFFAMALGIYAIGYINTGSNKNLLTVVAILGMLPASKSCVNMIMFLRFKSPVTEVNSDILCHASSKGADATELLFENVLTTTEKSYFLPVVMYRNHTIISYCENKGTEALKLIENHIKDSIKLEKIDVIVKVFKDKEQFCDRLDSLLSASPDEDDFNLRDVVYNTIKAISL